MVGDRIHDYDAARAVGMRCIAVTWGFGSAEEWAQADALCKSPADLKTTIQDLF